MAVVKGAQWWRRTLQPSGVTMRCFRLSRDQQQQRQVLPLFVVDRPERVPLLAG